jgi:type IV secretory pathway TrbL component
MMQMRLYSLVVVAVLCACSKQGEGDTCMRSNDNEDCASGLVCIEAERLDEYDKLGDAYAADRCCPEGRSSNSHCKRADASVDEGADTGNSVGGSESGGSTGTSGTAGGQGGSTGGT